MSSHTEPLGTAPVEPLLEMDQIQGLALPGFFKPHMTLVGVRYSDGQALQNFRGFLSTFQPSTARETLDDRRAFRAQRAARSDEAKAAAKKDVVLCAVAFSARGLTRLTPGARAIPGEAFQKGLAARSALLGDPTDPQGEGHVSNWVVGKPSEELDALLVLAGDKRAGVDARVNELLRLLNAAGVQTPYVENGDVRADQPGHEHFGFDDGVSQPGIRGLASPEGGDYVEDRHVDPREIPKAWLYGWPGQDLVWPGEFILGYPASSPDPLVAGQSSPAIPEWTRNGSFLVFRRLRQNVALFWQTMKTEAERLAALPGFEKMTAEYLAARLVGRWPSGAPVNRVPDADDWRLGKEPRANNHFRYDSGTPAVPLADGFKDPYPAAKADPVGITCPWAAHIRKVNVRDSGSDVGGRTASYSKRLLRTGIPFGRSLPNPFAAPQEDPEKGNRGLLFLSIQASIDNQFEFLVSRWMGDPTRPKTPAGHDILIGQNADPDGYRERSCVIFGNGLQQNLVSTRAEWVIPTGGGYFFLPSVSALHQVIAGN